METILSIVAGLSVLAFVVGMIRPAAVKCSSRGKVALVFLGLFIVCVFVGASLAEDAPASVSAAESGAEGATQEGAQSPATEIPTLSAGSVYTMKYGGGNVKITFEKIQANHIPRGGLNLVLSLVIKNNSNETFFISDCGWSLLDSDKVEVEDAGVYNPMFGGFSPSMFFFTTVEPNVGKREEVGYSVKEETYYLSVNGKIIAKIPLGGKS